MTKTQLFTQSSPWFILLCLLVGAAYSFFLYNRKPIWGRQLNILLAAIRFLVVSFICFLLLSPIVKQIKSYIEKPILVIAIDNSQSIKETHDSKFLNNVLKNLSQIKESLADRYQVEVQTFSTAENQKLDSLQFNYPVSNLSGFLSGLQSKYENMNLKDVVLISDGIYNQGISPDYLPYNFTILPVAMGDTIPKTDLNLKNILYNKIAYRGNKFPLVAEFMGDGYNDLLVNVSLQQNGRVIETQKVPFRRAGEVNQVTFYASSDVPGMQHYTISIAPVEGEYSVRNNIGHAYIDIIDNKEKILLVALSPHPDIKAIKSALETKENYEFQLYIPGATEPPKESRFDLIVFHQIPDLFNSALPVYNQFASKSKNHLFIIGAQSSLSQFNLLGTGLEVLGRGSQKDEVFPTYNNTFDKFTMATDHQDMIGKYPPVVVPYAEFKVPPSYDIVVYQKVGSVQTNKPIIAVGNEAGRKTGVIVGNGIWEWRLQEFALTTNTVVFDELITKVVQYLSAKEDKRKFRVYPVSNQIFENENVVLETEVYNNIYEKIYGQKIDLQITNEKNQTQKFTYINSQNNSGYEVGGLQPGVYKYRASTKLEGKTEVSAGEFIVKELQLESLSSTANHNILRLLANNTNGRVFYPSNINTIPQYLGKNEAQGKVHSSEEDLELIHLKWLFFLILGFISAEWILRKYNGAY